MGAPAGVVVDLLEYVPHYVLLLDLFLDQPHVQSHLPEETRLSLLPPLALRLLRGLASGPLR